MRQDKPHFINWCMAYYRGVKFWKAIDNSWNHAELWQSSWYHNIECPSETSEEQGQEAGIYERMANVEMSQAVGVRVGLSLQFNTFCFFLHLT